jgi:hypothetical protein
LEKKEKIMVYKNIVIVVVLVKMIDPSNNYKVICSKEFYTFNFLEKKDLDDFLKKIKSNEKYKNKKKASIGNFYYFIERNKPIISRTLFKDSQK